MTKVFDPFRGAEQTMKNPGHRAVLRFGLFLFCAWAAARGQPDLLPELSLDDLESGEESAAETAAPVEEENKTKEEADFVTDSVAALPDVASAREKAIGYLRGLASAENADGLFYPPDRRRTVLGWTVKDVRYAEKMVDVPVYEAVEEFRTVNVGDEYNPVMVRKKVVVQKVVGSRQEKRVVHDTNGPIVKQEKVPEYGPGGLDDWNSFQFGHNAMAITAMMRAGVDPEDEVIRGVADTLFDIYSEYGPPDLTWDLAWSTAAFSMIDTEAFQEMARRMAAKLIAGQIAEGPAAGLWGPVCVDRPLLAAMIIRKQQYSDIYLEAKRRYGEREWDSYKEKMEEAHQALRGLKKLMGNVAMLAPRFDAWVHTVQLVRDGGYSFTLPIYPEYIHNQASADMDSTAIAMFGLRVAAERELLPAETWSPESAPGRPLVPPRKTVEALRETVSTLARAQRREGWSELNLIQPVSVFDDVPGITGVPIEASPFPSLSSPLTGTSTVQGYSVYSSFGKMAGLRGLAPWGRYVVAGNAAVKSLLDAGLEELGGGVVPPFEACFFLSDPVDLGKAETQLGEWPVIAEFLLARQNDDGSWGESKRVHTLPSSLRERMETLPVVHYYHPPSASDLGRPHVYFNLEEEKHHVIRKDFLCPGRLLRTCYALLALSAEPGPEAEPGEPAEDGRL